MGSERDIPPPPDEDEKTKSRSLSAGKRGRKKIFAVIGVVAVLVIASSAGYLIIFRDQSTNPGANQATLSDAVRFPEDNQSVQNTVVGNGSITYVYSVPPSPSDLEYSIGNIIVGDTGMGYLRNVTAVQVSGNTVIVSTKNASLAEAIENGTIYFEGDLNFSSAIDITVFSYGSPRPAHTAATILNQSAENYDYYLDSAKSARLQGDLAVKCKLELSADFGFFSLKSAEIKLTLQTSFNFTLTTTSGITLTREIQVLETSPLDTLTINVFSKLPLIGKLIDKVFPCKITPKLDLSVGADISLTSSAFVTGWIGTNYVTGVKYNSNSAEKWERIRTLQEGLSVHNETSTSGTGYVTCFSMLPRITLWFFDMIGPTLFSEQGAKLVFSKYPNGDVYYDPYLSLHVGFNLRVQVLWFKLADIPLFTLFEDSRRLDFSQNHYAVVDWI